MQFVRSLLFTLFLWALCLAQTNAQIAFDSVQTYIADSWARVTAISDMNNDGLNDLVVGCASSNDPVNDYTIKIFYQDSLGALGTPVPYSYPPVYPGIATMAVGDVNNDGREDILIGTSNHAYLSFQDSAGGFSTFNTLITNIGAYDVIIGDLNNDGLKDMAISNYYLSYIQLYYQQANNNSFILASLPKVAQNVVGELAIGDVNNDGLSDLVQASRIFGGEGIHVYTQNAATGLLNQGTYFASVPSFGLMLSGISIGDLDQDGLNDVVASKSFNTPYAAHNLWFQDSTNNLLITPPTQFLAYELPRAVEIGDLDCNGQSEIITSHPGWGRTTITVINNQRTIDSVYYLFNLYGSQNIQGMAVGDLNGDGRKDIAQVYGDMVSVLYNKSEPDSLDFYEAPKAATIDSIRTTNLNSTSFLIEQKVDSTNLNYLNTQVDSFLVRQVIRVDSIWIDSLIISEAYVCAKRFADTTISSHLLVDTVVVDSDTTFWSSNIFIENTKEEFRLYPNPSTGTVTIELPSPFDEPNTDCTIFTETGQLLMYVVWKDKRNKRRLELGELSSSVYLLKLKHNSHSAVFRVVISR